jgi:hypothetical protein
MANGKISRGDIWKVPPADDWNNAIEAGAEHASGKLHQPGQRVFLPTPTDIVQVRNDTGSNLARGDSICIADFLLTDIDPEYLWFTGEQATTANKPCGILLDPIPDGEIGRVQMPGPCCFAKIDNDYADHPYAHPVAGEDHLSTTWYGHARILCRKEWPASSGQYWAAVMLGQFMSELLEVETAALIASGGSGTGLADVWWNGAVTSPLQQVTVHHKWLGTADAIADNTKLVVRFDRRLNQWRTIAEDCGA